MWRLWAKALGTKEGLTDKDADITAYIRTTLVLIQTICALFIIANIVYRWGA